MTPSGAFLLASQNLRLSSRISLPTRALHYRPRWRVPPQRYSAKLLHSNAYHPVSPYSLGATRPYSTAQATAVAPPDHLDDNERQIFEQLRQALDPVALQVQDVSGGCGTMFAVAVTSERFKGLPVIKQHRLVNEILGDKIKEWHGLQLTTKAP